MQYVSTYCRIGKLFILYKTFHFSDNLQRRFHYLILFFKSQFSLAIIRIVVMIYGCAEQSGFVAGDHSDWHIWWTHLTSSTVFFCFVSGLLEREGTASTNIHVLRFYLKCFDILCGQLFFLGSNIMLSTFNHNFLIKIDLKKKKKILTF